MPADKRPSKPHRLNLEMTDEVKARLDRLREETEADSQAEVIRRALAIYEHLVKRRKAGADVVIRRADGREAVLELA